MRVYGKKIESLADRSWLCDGTAIPERDALPGIGSTLRRLDIPIRPSRHIPRSTEKDISAVLTGDAGRAQVCAHEKAATPARLFHAAGSHRLSP
jgi:hypothetical protein